MFCIQCMFWRLIMNSIYDPFDVEPSCKTCDKYNPLYKRVCLYFDVVERNGLITQISSGMVTPIPGVTGGKYWTFNHLCIELTMLGWSIIINVLIRNWASGNAQWIGFTLMDSAIAIELSRSLQQTPGCHITTIIFCWMQSLIHCPNFNGGKANPCNWKMPMWHCIAF